MKYENIELIRDDGIAFIYLNRPKVLNALNETMKVELIHALKETEEDDNIRVMILMDGVEVFVPVPILTGL